MLLVALAMLIGVATPPVIEDHVEVGSAAPIVRSKRRHTTALAPRRAERHPAPAPVSIASARLSDAELGAVDAPDAPAPPPSA